MTDIASADIGHGTDTFMRQLVRHLSGSLEDVVDRPAGVVGRHAHVGRVGDDIDAQYRDALSLSRLDRAQVTEVLTDLKRRIDGDFHVIEEREDRIVFGNTRCPFGDAVIGRPSLCMMTSNVFGVIAAQNLGYAKVELGETIAAGHHGCTVTVYLQDTPAARDAEGREYFGPDRGSAGD